jgi:hypothetical protein
MIWPEVAREYLNLFDKVVLERSHSPKPHPVATGYRRLLQELAGRLLERFSQAEADWPWPEAQLTYANARLPQALIEAGHYLGNEAMLRTGLNSLRWLAQIQTCERGHFVPIGTNGWYAKGQVRARFDQQPIEVQVTLDACLAAYRATGERVWLQDARKAFEWFLGSNDLSVSLYD